jgi:hypothetical protein
MGDIPNVVGMSDGSVDNVGTVGVICSKEHGTKRFLSEDDT